MVSTGGERETTTTVVGEGRWSKIGLTNVVQG